MKKVMLLFVLFTTTGIISAQGQQGHAAPATLTDPAATALYSWETQKIGDWLDDIHSTATTTTGASQPKANVTAAPSSPSSPSTPSPAQGNIPKK